MFAARGGRYAGTPLDTQTPYLRNVLTFLGMSEVEFVFAEGLAMGSAAKERSLAKASAQAEDGRLEESRIAWKLLRPRPIVDQPALRVKAAHRTRH